MTRSAALIATGIYKKQQCALCKRWHLALHGAPTAAPCSLCSTAILALAPPPGAWSPAFIAHIEHEQATEATRLERGVVLDFATPSKAHPRASKRAA
jgi:hypothetical protein